MRLSNTARSFSEIATQASLFIPMTMPSATLPSYVALDPRSQWHVSGLLSTALESMTLPSRLKRQNTALQTLDQLANALNINGKQTTAKLRMSIDQKSAINGHQQSGGSEVLSQSRDMRLPSQERYSDEENAADKEDLTMFDMDFFPTEGPDQSRGRRRGITKIHVFGQAENYRVDGDLEDEVANGEDEGHERARRRAAGLPITHT